MLTIRDENNIAYREYMHTLNKYQYVRKNNERVFICIIMRTQIEYIVVFNYEFDYIHRVFIHTQNVQMFENNDDDWCIAW